MLKKEGKTNDAVIENMLSWRHTGFHVHIGARIWPDDENALENLAKFIIRASFSQERMICIPAEKSADGTAKVVYQSKDGKTEQTFDAIDWLARLVVHIPNKYEQLVRYVGYYVASGAISLNLLWIFPFASRSLTAIIPTSPEACAKRRKPTTSCRRSPQEK